MKSFLSLGKKRVIYLLSLEKTMAFNIAVKWILLNQRWELKDVCRLIGICKTVYHCIHSTSFFLDFLGVSPEKIKSLLETFTAPSGLGLGSDDLAEITSPIPSLSILTWFKKTPGHLNRTYSLKELLYKFPHLTTLDAENVLCLTDWPADFCWPSLEEIIFSVEGPTVLNLPLSMPNLQKMRVYSDTPSGLEITLNDDMKNVAVLGSYPIHLHGRTIEELSFDRRGGDVKLQCDHIDVLEVRKVGGTIEVGSIGCLKFGGDQYTDFSVRVETLLHRVELTDQYRSTEIALNPQKLSRENGVLTLPLHSVDDLLYSRYKIPYCSLGNTLVLDNDYEWNNYWEVLFSFPVKRLHVCYCYHSRTLQVNAEEVHVFSCPKCEVPDWLDINGLFQFAGGGVERDYQERLFVLKAYASDIGISEEEAFMKMGLRLIAFRMTGKDTPVFRH